ncbi:MAG: anti-sigma factor antagonist [Ruminococcus sp.]|nr:anti-sigma factor antagonist [Ruminococcus sp.]
MPCKLFYDAESRSLLAELSGDIDHCSAKGLREPVDKEIMTRLPLHLILDFSGVGFMDSSGIGLIIGRYKLMNDMGGDLLITDPCPEVRKIMELAGVGRLCRVIQSGHRSFSGGVKL